jgi:acyl homoserine lactone synthase
MFRDRADQFAGRLGWAVTVDASGAEHDDYDAEDPLYVIWEQEDGTHGGSMRFLPTTGRTMINDHFVDLVGAEVTSPLIWECTRFCLSRNAGPNVSAALMLGGAEVGVNFHLRHSIAVFDARMVRVYRALGWPPTITGTTGTGRDAISAGLWEHSRAIRNRMAEKAGITVQTSAAWFAAAFDESHADEDVRAYA